MIQYCCNCCNEVGSKNFWRKRYTDEKNAWYDSGEKEKFWANFEDYLFNNTKVMK